MDQELTDKLFKIKEEIEEKKTDKARLEGQISTLMGDLKKTFKISTIEEAKKKLDKMKKDMEKLEVDFTTGMGKLEEEYNAVQL